MDKENSAPAFPVESDAYAHLGMSLRDYFAAKAMLGQMQREKDFGKTVREQGFAKYAAHIAETSYQLADAMLAARSA